MILGFRKIKELRQKYLISYLKIYKILRNVDNIEDLIQQLEDLSEDDEAKKYDYKVNLKIDLIIEKIGCLFDFSIAEDAIFKFPAFIHNELKNKNYCIVGLAQDAMDLYWVGIELGTQNLAFFSACMKLDYCEKQRCLTTKEIEEYNKILNNNFNNNEYEELIYNSITGKLYLNNS